MAERGLDQWWRVTRRWCVLGAVVGIVAAGWFAVTDPSSTPLGLATFVPLCAASALILRYSVYRYDYAKVWGWRALGLLALVWGALTAVGIGGLCATGGCGE